LAETGPIVVFNVSDLRSDAIIVRDKADVHSLSLHSLDHPTLKATAERFLNSLEDAKYLQNYGKAISELTKILKWLWNVAVAPVLDELGFSETPLSDGSWPRIWWVGSGFLNLLPIHAAGYHAVDCNNSTID
jgi:hypothetical protein